MSPWIFIELAQSDGSGLVTIQANHIAALEDNGFGGTSVWMIGGKNFDVKLSRHQVMEMIERANG